MPSPFAAVTVITLTLITLSMGSAAGNAEGTHACVVYIDRDVVDEESFLGYIAEYSSDSNGGSTPFEDDLRAECIKRTFEERLVPCAEKVAQSVCHGGEFTHFIPVRSHEATINGSQFDDEDPQDPLNPIFRPIYAAPSPNMPEELFAYPSKVLPGMDPDEVDHLFVFFIGVHPLLVWEAAAAMILRAVPLDDFTFVYHPIVSPSFEFKKTAPPLRDPLGGNDCDAEDRDLPSLTEPPRPTPSFQQDTPQSRLYTSEDALWMYPYKSPIPPQYRETFPIVFIDLDPLTHGYLMGVMSYRMTSHVNVTVAQWENDDYSRAFLSGVSHGVRLQCQSCNVRPVVVTEATLQAVLTTAISDPEPPFAIILPYFPLHEQADRNLIEDLISETRRGEFFWGNVFVNQDFYYRSPYMRLKGIYFGTFVVGRLQNFSKTQLIRGGRTHGYWYSKPRAVPMRRLRDLGLEAADFDYINQAVTVVVEDKVQFPFDWKTGFALPTNTSAGYQYLGDAGGLAWDALWSNAFTISSDIVALVADDLSSIALYNPRRHLVMEINYDIGKLLQGKVGYSISVNTPKLYISGGVLDGPQPHALGDIVEVKILRNANYDILCDELENSCFGGIEVAGSLPIPLYGHTSITHLPYIYIHGGRNAYTGLLQNVLYRARQIHGDNTFEWEALSTEGSVPRSYHTSMVYWEPDNTSEYIFFLGSEHGSSILSWYNIEEDTWGSFDMQSIVASRPCMTFVEESVLAMSGNTMYRFDPPTQTLFQQRQTTFTPTHTLSCTNIETMVGYLIPQTPYWQETKNKHTTTSPPPDAGIITSHDNSDSNTGENGVSVGGDEEASLACGYDNSIVVTLLFQSATDSIGTMTFPRTLQCSGNQVQSPMRMSCVDCKEEYIADVGLCTPCESFSDTDSARFATYCPSTPPSSLHWAIIAGPIVATVLVAVTVLVLWCLQRRRRDLPHQRRCNAPSSGGVFVVYFWVDKAPQLWKERSNDMAEVSSQLVQLLRCMLARHECYEVVNCGDSGLFTGRDAERVLRASTEAWLQVAQRQWCVGKLRANFLLHYDDFQCVETDVDSEYSGLWRWLEIGRRARTAMTLTGGGIQHLQRTAMYVQGIVGSSKFLAEYARARGDELAPLAAYIDSVDGARPHATKPPVPPHAQWEDGVVFSVADPSLDAALAPEPVLLACAHWLQSCMNTIMRQRDDPILTRAQRVGLDVVREHGMLSECGDAAVDPTASASSADEARQRYPLVGLVKGDTVLTTYEVLLQGEVAPRHVRLPLRCFEVNAMMTITPQCKHSPEIGAADDTFARLLCDRDALTAEERMLVSRYQCEHCRRCVPRRVRCCRLEVVRPMEQAAPSRCPFFRLSVSTHRVAVAARLAEESRQKQRVELLHRARIQDNRPTMLGNVPRDLWPVCQSVVSAASSVSADDRRDALESDILYHPMVVTGLVPAELFVHVVRIVEKLYNALLSPLRADERLEVAESVRLQLRLFTDTYPDSPERSREVALRLLQVMDMLHIKDIVDNIASH